MKKFLVLISVLFAYSCANSGLNSPIIAVLKPIHSITTGLKQDNGQQNVRLFDNDGNLYFTQWDVPASKVSEFNQQVAKCRENNTSLISNTQGVNLDDTEVSNITATLYKPFANCVAQQRHPFVSGDGFRPDGFLVEIYRGHSKKTQYMPVGSNFKLVKKSAEFRDTFIMAKACHAKARTIGNKGVEEEQSEGDNRVSIESYTASLEKCFSDAGYEVFKKK